MKLNIQLFGTFDSLINTYNTQISNAKKQITANETEKNNLLNSYNENYQKTLNEYNDLINKEQEYIDTWANTEKENKQKQTDYNINLINQNKEETKKQTNSELGDAYIDYQKGLNQFAGNAEKMASSGLTGTGFNQNSEIAMNITYQNRVSTAKSALTKANTEYDNQIQQALLNNDAALAEIALQQMQQSYQLALQGFEYKETLYNNKLTYEQGIRDSYFNRNQTLQSNINSYNSAITSIKQAEAQLAEEKRQFNASYNASYGGGSYTDSGTKYQVNTAYYQGNKNSDCKYGTFSNGYQPNNINGKKLTKTGYTMTLNTKTLSGQKQTVVQNVWKTPDGKLWYWDGRYNKYIQYKK